MSIKAKKTIKKVVNIFLWIFLAFSVLMTVVAISATSNGDGMPSIGKTSLMSVQSGSMTPTFRKGDLLLVHVLSEEEKNDIQVGDIITFVDKDLSKGTDIVFTTHRVEEVFKREDGWLVSCRTKGDNVETNPIADTTIRTVNDIRGIWRSETHKGVRLPGVGSAIDFLRTSMGFFICIVLPLLILFLYQLVVFIKMAIEVKNKGKKVISAADEEMIKQQAIAEFLAAQKAEPKSDKTEDDGGQ